MMKFREDRSLLGLGLPSGGFHDRYFILNSSCLRLYKEIRVSGPAGSCLALHQRVHRHPCTGVPLGLPVGSSLLRGLGPIQQWPWVATQLCSVAPLGPGTWMPSHQACAFPHVPVPCYDIHRHMLQG